MDILDLFHSFSAAFPFFIFSQPAVDFRMTSCCNENELFMHIPNRIAGSSHQSRRHHSLPAEQPAEQPAPNHLSNRPTYGFFCRLTNLL